MKAFLLTLLLGVAAANVQYALKDAQGSRYCFLMDVDFDGVVQYETNNKTVDYKFKVEKAGEVLGECHTTFNKTISATRVVIEFLPNGITPPMTHAQKLWNITLTFADMAAKNEYELVDYSVGAIFYPTIFDSTEAEIKYTKDPNAENTVHWAKAEKTPHAFSCSSSGVSFVKESKLALNNLKVLPFASLDKAEFPGNQQFDKCPMDTKTSDIVPIVVGACLAGLVIIVLIAYLIGRARARRQGYASV
ncbi:hypothetical protein L596_019498 [Steinernema carpocapsae]|uniref:Lysosome-associated membrane glycoprotein 2-like transmembrane domain-containing protein n=1 Tax=Steinernema carpocapsae TaxID=34508 RepID=A0A4U5MQQ1_STECR|nr:hypothetical protein L596_019498 [Steinernema carpocapsae]